MRAYGTQASLNQTQMVKPRPASAGSQDVRRHEARLALALEAAGLGSWEFNLTTGSLSATDRCKANHGLGPEAELTLERDIIGTIDASHQQAFRDALEATMRDGRDMILEVPNTWPDGSHHWLLIRGRMVDAECLLGVTLDVTERRRMEEALRLSDQRKDDFLALLGHELRNPLAPILAAAKFLEIAGAPDPKLQRARDTIIRQAKQLTRIVDDLLDVGRINAGKLALHRSRFDLNDAVRQAAESCGPLIERQRHTLDMNLSPGPVFIDADATRIVQMAANLVTNAAKYMDEGGRVEIATEARGGQAILRVRDEGIGIAPEMLDAIFERFVQVGASRARAEGGLGLGLSLVKAIVDLHDGAIDARSAGLGMGSEFTVRLPAAG